MFKQIQASDRTKPKKEQYFAIITDELAMNKYSGMLGRLLMYQPTMQYAIAQQRRWKKEYPAVRTRVVELNRGDIPLRHYVDPLLHLASSDSQYMR
jgi:hypothetical protein